MITEVIVQEVVFKSQLLKDGHLYCPKKFADPKAIFKVTVSLPDEEEVAIPRPFGLCKGEFTVPDDFDAPLPDYIIKEFEDA
jgi:hypothetical protein